MLLSLFVSDYKISENGVSTDVILEDIDFCQKFTLFFYISFYADTFI